MNKHFLKIENMLLAKDYKNLINYLDDLNSKELIYRGLRLYLDKILKNQNIKSDNPYFKFYNNELSQLKEHLLHLDDDFHNLYLGHLTQDSEEAESYYFQAAKIYQSKAYLGKIYLQQQKYQEARYLFEITNQFLFSPYYLGKIYEQGLGVTKDHQKAIAYYEESSRLGYQDATFILATTYKEKLNQKYGKQYCEQLIANLLDKAHPQTILMMIDFAKSESEQIKIVTKAIKADDRNLKYQIGLNYYYGKTLPKNKDLARYWFELATQLNHWEAKKFLEDHFD